MSAINRHSVVFKRFSFCFPPLAVTPANPPVLAWNAAARTDLESELTDAAAAVLCTKPAPDADGVPGENGAEEDGATCAKETDDGGPASAISDEVTPPSNCPTPLCAISENDVATVEVTSEGGDAKEFFQTQQDLSEAAKAPALLKSCSETEVFQLNDNACKKNPSLRLTPAGRDSSSKPQTPTELIVSPDEDACILLNGDHEREWVEISVSNQLLSRPVVPNRGGIPPQGGISCVQGRNVHFVVSSPIHCKCCVSFLS